MRKLLPDEHRLTLIELGKLMIGHGKTLVAGALFALLGIGTTIFSVKHVPPWIWFGLLAASVLWVTYRACHDLRLARDEAARRFNDQLKVVSLQFGTELRDIRRSIEIVRSARPHPHYSDGFALPGFRWDEYDATLASLSTDLYRVVERAYSAAHHVNQALQMRRTRAGIGQTLGVTSDENLDAAYDAAGEALDLLGEERGAVWQSPVQRAVRGTMEDLGLIENEAASRIAKLIRDGEVLYDSHIDAQEHYNRWIADHAAWRDRLKAELSEEDYIQAFNFGGLNEPEQQTEHDLRPAKARIDRIISNLRKLHVRHANGPLALSIR